MSIGDAELLAQKFRIDAGLGMSEPVNVKSLFRRFNILAIYRPLSQNSYGISIKADGSMFMLINSNSTRGRQHFTVAHELVHLFYDENPEPHVCNGKVFGVERDANRFASALLMPREGVLSYISENEMTNHCVDLATILKLEQLYGVSRMSLLLRLKDLGVIGESFIQEVAKKSVKGSALAYGYDLSLYERGNENLVVGDFGVKARLLFEQDKISEGHYVELSNMVCDGKREDGEDHIGC